jgi:hypothetical protein
MDHSEIRSRLVTLFLIVRWSSPSKRPGNMDPHQDRITRSIGRCGSRRKHPVLFVYKPWFRSQSLQP